MEELIDTIRKAIDPAADPEAKSSGANACRAVLAVLEAEPGKPLVPPPVPNTPIAAAVETPAPSALAPETTATPSAAAAHKPTSQADRSLMKRSTYCGVVDTGPVPGESFAQKVERLAKLSAAVKQRADGG